MAGRLVRPAERGHALDQLGVGGVARGGQAGQVALDVRHEDRDAGLRQLAGHQLEGLRLTGARGSSDQPVAIEHRQGDLDPGVVGQLAVMHRAADDDPGFGQGIAGRHRIVERLIHGSSEGRDGRGRRVVGKGIIGRTLGRSTAGRRIGYETG